MNGLWSIENNLLVINTDNQTIYPNAKEIYSALSQSSMYEIQGVLCPPITEALPQVYFSRLGTDVYLRLYNNDVQEIFAEFYCINGKKINVCLVDGHLSDYCLIENKWFYLSGNVDLFNSLISRLNITENKITLFQYLEIIKDSELIDNFAVKNDVILDAPSGRKIQPSPIPQGIALTPFDYQTSGYSWMKYMLHEYHGCILGDEMGLGKTFQVICVIQSLLNEGNRNILIAAPVSLLNNWVNELNKFAPEIKSYIHHGEKRTGWYKELEKYDVVVISYQAAKSDFSMLKMIEWSLIIVDEAQNIKNPGSERTKFLKKLPRKCSIAMSGTPFENHVGDIWSIADFVIPGIYGTLRQFSQYVTDDLDGAYKVEPMLTPIMIRRMVSDVALSLPDKIEIPQSIIMPVNEQLSYEKYRKEILNAIDTNAIKLGDIQKLRMYCTHPSLVDNSDAIQPETDSLKYQRLVEILEEIFSNNEKALVFTSFTKMFDILKKDLTNRFGINVFSINGSTEVEQRQKIVDDFNAIQGSSVLVLNPTAAGTGLNITSANHVIHYNLEWNPAKEDQATARAYRTGQKKTVFVYRLYYEGTVEELIEEKIERKRTFAKTAIVGNDGMHDNKSDILSALLRSPLMED